MFKQLIDRSDVVLFEFRGADSYTATGSKMVTIPAGAAVLGTKLVATATDNGGASNTSEFSANATVASMLIAAEGAAPTTTAKPAALTSAQLAPIVDAAIARLGEQGLAAAQMKHLSSVTVSIADLPGATLGLATPRTITLDANAAGYGWFADPTPRDDAEFSSGTQLSTLDSQLRMDLLTAVMHELGHELGYDHDSDFDSMIETLTIGTRRVP